MHLQKCLTFGVHITARRGAFLYTYRFLINMFSVLRYYLYAARYGIDQLCENAV